MLIVPIYIDGWTAAGRFSLERQDTNILQVAELEYSGNRIICDRNKPVYINLGIPGN
jgi:hypothetical protein